MSSILTYPQYPPPPGRPHRARSGGGARRLRSSVAGGGVADDDQGVDLAVADGEVVGQDQLAGQVRLVEGAVVAAADDGLTVMVDDLGDLDAHPVTDHLLGHPAGDGLVAPELPVRVV